MQRNPNSMPPKPRRKRPSKGERKRRKKAKAEAEAKANEPTFQCTICYETKPVGRKMNEAEMGCGCTGEMCGICFIKDFMRRKRPYWVDGNRMSQWDDMGELTGAMAGACMDANKTTEATSSYIHEHLHAGRSCPFCGQEVLWTIENEPHLFANGFKIRIGIPMGQCTHASTPASRNLNLARL